METTTTQIQLQKTTVKRFKKHKLTKRESYDEMLNRLLKVWENK